jgi:hypothetical protein
MSSRLIIDRLRSGGVITNYFCTSACRHCLYRCSPAWPREYISEGAARENFSLIRSLGCNSVHIGGGEPLLRPDGLFPVLEAAAATGVAVDYVETNSSWYRDHGSAMKILAGLRRHGASTLLVSISPLHNEFIPFARVKGVLAACRDAGMNVVPWSDEFIADLDGLDDTRPHSIAEYEALFGSGYLEKIPGRYWISPGGRALETFAPFRKQQTAADLAACSGPCRELAETGHFHLDLFGNYIPGLCAGLAINREDLGTRLSPGDYPVLTVLYNAGVGGLLELVAERHGYRPRRTSYGSKCELCHEIRKFLVVETGTGSRELLPRQHYTLDHGGR